MLARWSSWGALPEVFDESKTEWAEERRELQTLLSEQEWDQARRTTINAHYTDPAYARAIWDTLEGLGFTGGDVLEPGSGAGTFIGLAPAGARVTGVELDPVTARIAAQLYPQAEIRAESFVDTRFPAGHFDATVGNVPFANVALHDPSHNAGNHTMHNHFIIKSLALTRPGGVVAVLTSSFTMDAQNPAARRTMHEMGDLIGAVRLPSGAHRRSAGTEVVTDLLVFRRRSPGEYPEPQPWDHTSPMMIDGERTNINAYFHDHPEHVLGDLHVGQGMFGAATLQVTGNLSTVAEDLRGALTGIVRSAVERGQVMTPRTAESAAQRAAFVPADEHAWDGTIVVTGKDTFGVVENGGVSDFRVPKAHAREVRTLLELRDTARSLLEAEAATTDDTAEIASNRALLGQQYRSYVERFGPINRFTLRPTGRVDEQGEPRMARLTPTAVRLIGSDPFGPLVTALEQFDDETQTATPAAIQRQRVVTRREPARGADSGPEAIALSLNEYGRIELDYIASMLGQSPEDARATLGELVYEDPTTGRLHAAAEYLSGDVRVKLAEAQAAAVDDPARYNANVAALREVMPADVESMDIRARLGAVWISPETHQQFLAQILQDRSIRVENPLPGKWKAKGLRNTVRATSEWGTPRRPATEIAEALMEQRDLIVYDEYEGDDGRKKRVINPVETTAAQEKGDALQERFAEWVWEEPERAVRLQEEYNRRFNSIVLRDYSREAESLTLPGLVEGFTPRPHQRVAVARMLAEPAVGLFHEVGAGKTAEMVIGTMELKRMGLVSKPAVIVPNHMLEQFTREWLQLYPQARILAASSDDLAGDKRRRFVARAAANDWDAVIFTQSAFERIPLSPASERDYLESQVAGIREALAVAKEDAQSLSVKRIEKAVLSAEERIKRLADRAVDAGLTFEETGLDYLVVDEFHLYKNLQTESSIRDAAIDGSKKASDMHMKLEYLRRTHGERVATVATATPIANSITEAHVMQRYLRPDLLDKAGILNFDAWAATFGETVSEMEMSPAGNGQFRMKTRFARFQNVPEMLRLWHVFADVKTAEDLNLPTPDLRARADGQRAAETIVLQPGTDLEAYIEEIGVRAQRIADKAVQPEEDNMLWVSSDGRKAAVDIRMIRDDLDPGEHSKIDALTANVHSIWEQNKDRTYLDPATDEPSPTPGALQIVFLDLGTPNEERWNAYDEIRRGLVSRGMPSELIRYVHEARNDSEKARMFAAARSGHIAVLIGSTSKMGVGTNVQARAIALHHVDCPWRPADIQQRDGRIMRQGNQNDEVGIYRYVVERSFDGYSWQTVERKARFISQVTRGRLDVREIEDIGGNALSAAEAKALASGNPLLLEHAVANSELAKMQRLERAYQRNKSNLGLLRQAAASRVSNALADLDALRAAAPLVVDLTGEKFAITLGDERYTSRAEASTAFARIGERAGIRWVSGMVSRDLGQIGKIGNFEIHAELSSGTVLGSQPNVVMHLDGVPRSRVIVTRDEFLQGGVGLITRLENRASGIERTISEVQATIDESTATVADVDERAGAPFKHAAELDAAKERMRVVTEQLDALARPAPEPTRAAPETDAYEADNAAALAALGSPRTAPSGSTNSLSRSRATDADQPTRAADVTR